MIRKIQYRPALLLLLLSLLLAGSADAQKRSRAKAVKAPSGVLWQRVDIPSQDLFYGRGGKSRMPNIRRISFIREDKGGYSKKYRIRDGSGRVWVAKIGKEAQSETAAVRLLGAIGYETETVYLVKRLTIPGKGTFTNVRLEARPASIDRGKDWEWEDNPFVGTHELQGLKIMMAMINNWDLKDSNNVVLKSRNGRFYVISDLGATFGKMGLHSFPLLRWIGRTRNDPKDYSKSSFVKDVDKGRVKLKYTGKNPGLFSNITVAQARWLADLLTQLSERQIRDAFRAANYGPVEVDILARAFEDRIVQLDRAASYRVAGIR